MSTKLLSERQQMAMLLKDTTSTSSSTSTKESKKNNKDSGNNKLSALAKQQLAKPLSVWQPKDFFTWTAPRQAAWMNLAEDPSPFYYWYVPPGFGEITTAWTADEVSRLRLICEARMTPEDALTPSSFAYLSMLMPGRTGLQLHQQFKLLQPKRNIAALSPLMNKFAPTTKHKGFPQQPPVQLDQLTQSTEQLGSQLTKSLSVQKENNKDKKNKEKDDDNNNIVVEEVSNNQINQIEPTMVDTDHNLNSSPVQSTKELEASINVAVKVSQQAQALTKKAANSSSSSSSRAMLGQKGTKMTLTAPIKPQSKSHVPAVATKDIATTVTTVNKEAPAIVKENEDKVVLSTTMDDKDNTTTTVAPIPTTPTKVKKASTTPIVTPSKNTTASTTTTTKSSNNSTSTTQTTKMSYEDTIIVPIDTPPTTALATTPSKAKQPTRLPTTTQQTQQQSITAPQQPPVQKIDIPTARPTLATITPVTTIIAPSSTSTTPRRAARSSITTTTPPTTTAIATKTIEGFVLPSISHENEMIAAADRAAAVALQPVVEELTQNIYDFEQFFKTPSTTATPLTTKTVPIPFHTNSFSSNYSDNAMVHDTPQNDLFGSLFGTMTKRAYSQAFLAQENYTYKSLPSPPQKGENNFDLVSLDNSKSIEILDKQATAVLYSGNYSGNYEATTPLKRQRLPPTGTIAPNNTPQHQQQSIPINTFIVSNSSSLASYPTVQLPQQQRQQQQQQSASSFATSLSNLFTQQQPLQQQICINPSYPVLQQQQQQSRMPILSPYQLPNQQIGGYYYNNTTGTIASSLGLKSISTLQATISNISHQHIYSQAMITQRLAQQQLQRRGQ